MELPSPRTKQPEECGREFPKLSLFGTMNSGNGIVLLTVMDFKEVGVFSTLYCILTVLPTTIIFYKQKLKRH